MRDYDDTFKDMKKENFNLKLRIFFLEERLGTGKKTNAEDLANNNLELKVNKINIFIFQSICWTSSNIYIFVPFTLFADIFLYIYLCIIKHLGHDSN